MNGVEVLRDVRVTLVREGSHECSGGGVDHGVSVIGEIVGRSSKKRSSEPPKPEPLVSMMLGWWRMEE